MATENKKTPARNPLHDLRNLVFLIWKHLRLPNPTPLQYAICNSLQYGDKRMVLQAFRGAGKSYLTSAFVIQQLLINPNANILVVSASKNRADAFTTFTLRLLEEIPELAPLRPRANQRNSRSEFDVGPATASQSASVRSAGITGQITGYRADIIIADDVEVQKNSLTQDMRDKLSESIKEFDSILKPLQSARIIFLGTPQTEYSIYKTLEERGYSIVKYPARIPNDPSNQNLFIQTLVREGSKPGDSVDPIRFDENDFLERELSIGKSTFALQFLLDTTLSDQNKFPLRLSDLIICDADPELAPEKIFWSNDLRYQLEKEIPSIGLRGDRFYSYESTEGQKVPYTASVMSIDPSGRGADATGYAVCKTLNGYAWLLDAGGLNGGYDNHNLEQLAKIAATFGVQEVVIESNFGDGMFARLFEPVLRKINPKARISEVRSVVQKEKRIIDSLEPLLNRHKLVVAKSLVRKDYFNCTNSDEEKTNRSLFFQMTRLTKERGCLQHDDIIDALAIAVQALNEFYSVDPDKMASARAWRQFAREHREFQAFGNNQKKPQQFWSKPSPFCSALP